MILVSPKTLSFLLTTLATASAVVVSSSSSCPLQCANNGTCKALGGESHRCDCPPGFTGTLCDVSYPSCLTADCENGGACLLGELDDFGNPQPYCDCTKGAVDPATGAAMFRGEYCRHPVVASSKEEEKTCTKATQALFCLHGGKCNPNYPTFGDLCLCKPGFSGDRCQATTVTQASRPPPTSPTPIHASTTSAAVVPPTCQGGSIVCANGGTCENDTCQCPTGFAGPACEVVDDPLTSTTPTCGAVIVCGNGGTCDARTKECQCPVGFTGPACELIDDHPPTTTAKRTTCQGGSIVCGNGGTCDTASDTCQCPIGFAGPACEVVDDPLTSTTPTCGRAIVCGNGGTCDTRTNECQCPVGFTGPACELVDHPPSSTAKRTTCQGGSLVCANGGTCDATSDTCQCPVGFAGPACEVVDDPLTSTTPTCGRAIVCGNGGTCNTRTNECQCPVGFTGPACELIDHPLATPTVTSKCTVPCQNGGSCRVGFSGQGGGGSMPPSFVLTDHTDGQGPHCVCPPGFVGAYCEFKQSLSSEEFCGVGRHLCPGSKSHCVAYGDELLCACGTLSLNRASFFEASFCEHPEIDMCTIGVSKDKHIIPNGGGSLSYCANGGRCKKTVRRGTMHAGCHCLDGFLGPYCEIPEAAVLPRVAMSIPYTIKAMPTSRSGGNIGTTVGVIVMIAIACWVVRRKRPASWNRVRQFLSTRVLGFRKKEQSDDQDGLALTSGLDKPSGEDSQYLQQFSDEDSTGGSLELPKKRRSSEDGGEPSAKEIV